MNKDVQKTSRFLGFRAICSLTMVCLLIIFTLQNAEVVTVRFLVWTVSMSRVLVLFVVFAIGLAFGWILRSWVQHKRRQRA